ncbi:MAG: TRAP transporter substrate-binding protein DctP [Kiritimatiellia bacterium]
MNVFQRLLIMLVTASSLAGAQTIKLGSLAPEGSPYHAALMEMAEAWREISDGKVNLRIYPGGIVGDESDMLRKMRIGQLHGAAVTSVNLINITPDIEAFSFPTMVRTDEELDAVIREVGPVIEKQLDERGFTLLSWTLAGWVHFFARSPVITPEDLQQQKLFFWGSDTSYIELLKRTGFQPVSLPVGELLPALQSGLVEAFASPPTVALAFQWYPRANHLTAMRWQPLPGCVLIDNRQWRKIPEALRPQLIEVAQQIAGKLMAESRILEQDAIAALREHGVELHEVPENVRQQWIELVEREGFPIFVGPRFSQDMFERVGAVTARFRDHDEE